MISIFAYAIMPDNTRNANFQVVELAKQPPGTKAMVLLKPSHAQVESQTWIESFFLGKNDPYEPIVADPEGEVFLKDEEIHYTTLYGQKNQVNLPEFLLRIAKDHPVSVETLESDGHYYHRVGDEISYIDLDGNTSKASLKQLNSDFRKKHIRRFTYRLGSDSYGRDVLSRLILGSRVSLAVGFCSVLVSLFIGITLGALAGFFGGWVDQVIMWITSVIWSIPTILLAIAISFSMEKGFWQVFLAIGLSMWVEVARIVRGQIFTIRETQYVEAAKVMGFSSFRTIFRHVLPNIISPVIIIAAANFASAILIEAGLSFLGIGVKNVPTWGSMIYEGYTYIIFENGKWLAIFPGLAIVLVVISLNLVGFGLRDALDPKFDYKAA